MAKAWQPPARRRAGRALDHVEIQIAELLEACAGDDRGQSVGSVASNSFSRAARTARARRCKALSGCSPRAERVTGLLRRAADHVAQRDHLALTGRQALDRIPDHPQRLGGLEPRRARAPARPPSDRGSDRGPRPEAVGPQPLLVVSGARKGRRERQRARVAHAARLGHVDEYPVDPGLESRASLEPLDAAQHPEPGFLEHLLGRGVGGDVDAGHPQQAGAELVDEPPERGLVAGAQRRQGVGFGRLEAAHGSQARRRRPRGRAEPRAARIGEVDLHACHARQDWQVRLTRGTRHASRLVSPHAPHVRPLAGAPAGASQRPSRRRPAVGQARRLQQRAGLRRQQDAQAGVPGGRRAGEGAPTPSSRSEASIEPHPSGGRRGGAPASRACWFRRAGSTGRTWSTTASATSSSAG